MATKLKANVQYQPIVESVSRKFVPKKVTCCAPKGAGPVSIESTPWMGGGVRTTARAGLGGCTKNYLIIRTMGRSTALTSKEMNARTAFEMAAKGRNSILMNLNQITRVQQMFLQARADLNKKVNGKSAYGYTFKGWIFAVQYAGWVDAIEEGGQEYDVYTFPQNFDN